ncbi:type II CAAX prenyl endopeptidase Rce1 family protein [Glutamicibacter protophormiae]|uniref:CPBP family glutamic-type intramembrane protease n=1 Tax=Glutamicibacter protophormiae TaxID=37930 RepID=UPI003BAE4B5D
MSMTSNAGLPAPAEEVDEPRYEFHRLLRREENYRWWRPLALLGTAAGFFAVLSIIVALISLVMMMFNPVFWSDDAAALEQLTVMDMADPMMFSILMVSLIVMIPSVWFAYLLLGAKPVCLLVSVAGKIRWGWMGTAFAVSGIVYAAYFALTFILDALDAGGGAQVPASSIPDSPLFYALLVILLTPLQCAAEELVFRGAFMQVIGSWLKHPLFAILLPVPLFTAGHLYDIYGLLDVAIFAIAAGYLTWRTGGLEAAIAIHVVNNTSLFLLGSVGLVDLNAKGSDPVSLLISGAMTAILTVLLVKVAQKKDIQRSVGPAPRRRTDQHLLQPWPIAYPMPPQHQAYWAPEAGGNFPGQHPAYRTGPDGVPQPPLEPGQPGAPRPDGPGGQERHGNSR